MEDLNADKLFQNRDNGVYNSDHRTNSCIEPSDNLFISDKSP